MKTSMLLCRYSCEFYCLHRKWQIKKPTSVELQTTYMNQGIYSKSRKIYDDEDFYVAHNSNELLKNKPIKLLPINNAVK